MFNSKLAVHENAAIAGFSMKETLLSLALLMSVITLFALNSDLALAGTDTTFDTWTTQLTDYMEGSLGKGVSIAFILVGIIMGITRQSLMAIAVGVGCALGLNYAPDIIDTMFSATLISLPVAI